MNKNAPLYTKADNCQDCYKCIRECPVKAIGIREGRAYIDPDKCIFCGHCVTVCPVGAKKIRNDVARVKNLVRYYKTAISIAPSFVSEFDAMEKKRLVGALKQLGFKWVSETALGAEVVTAGTVEMLKEKNGGVHISSACPVVVEYIRKYRPEFIDNIIKLPSPLMTHANMLKKEYGVEKVVFAGPCAAKKLESDRYPDFADAALTFGELREWLKEENIEGEEGDVFFPRHSGDGALYPVEGGMIQGFPREMEEKAVSMSFSGMSSVKEIIDSLDSMKSSMPVFLELLACSGGCVNGPAAASHESDAVKRLSVISEASVSDEMPSPLTNVLMDIRPSGVQKYEFSKSEIDRTLRTIGKYSAADELNCGGCGYNSCRDFARALLGGMAEEDMCVSYMRKVAQDKATMLLNKIPSGVILVDGKMRIIESNAKFSTLIGKDLEMIFKVQPGLKDMDAREVVPFHKIFSSLLASGDEQLDKDVKINNGLLHVTAFTVQKHRIVGAVIRDLYVPEVRKELVVNKSRKIIKENLETVQKIAYLLGENAARTEEMLNTIIESHLNGGNDESST